MLSLEEDSGSGSGSGSGASSSVAAASASPSPLASSRAVSGGPSSWRRFNLQHQTENHGFRLLVLAPPIDSCVWFFWLLWKKGPKHP